MNNQIETTLYERAKLLHNLDKILDAARKKTKYTGMVSLFTEDETYTDVILEEPEDFNPLEMVRLEQEVLGSSLLYSEYEPFEAIRCRYCTSTLNEIFGEVFEGNRTFLAKLVEIDQYTSTYGNPLAKLKFSCDGVESRMYLFGDLYKRNIFKCFTNRIYLVTVSFNKERNSMNLVNFMEANDITDIKATTLWVSAKLNKLEMLKKYLYCYMMGDKYDVNIHVQDGNHTFINVMKCNIDNENLVEMRKHGLIVKLR